MVAQWFAHHGAQLVRPQWRPRVVRQHHDLRWFASTGTKVQQYLHTTCRIRRAIGTISDPYIPAQFWPALPFCSRNQPGAHLWLIQNPSYLPQPPSPSRSGLINSVDTSSQAVCLYLGRWPTSPHHRSLTWTRLSPPSSRKLVTTRRSPLASKASIHAKTKHLRHC